MELHVFHHHDILGTQSDPRIDQVIGLLASISGKLDSVLAAQTQERAQLMALDNEIVKLQSDVTAESTVIDSATALINGIQAQIQAAVQAALAAGATPAQLQALTDLDTSITTKSAELAQAVAANTTPPPPPPTA